MLMTNALLEKLIPHLSSFTECEAPDMSEYDPQSHYWVRNYLLNSTFRGRYPDPFHQIAFAYMRRAEAAFTEYGEARTYALGYLGGLREAVSNYLAALYHFEQFVTQAYLGYLLLRRLLANDKLFSPKDGSVPDRLNQIYNCIKHADDRIVAGEFPIDSTAPVWLTNQGIATMNAAVSYQEMAETLRDLAGGANRFGDPVAVAAEK